MQNSAELRWFWKADAVTGLSEWFVGPQAHNGIAAGGGALRIDVYLYDPRQHELGIKQRGGKPGIEIKGLVRGSPSVVVEDSPGGGIQLWSKWTLHADILEDQPVVVTKKRRWLRKFAEAGAGREIALNEKEEPKDGAKFPPAGCNVELTRIELSSAVWWSFGFESFGGMETLEPNLVAARETMRVRGYPWPRDAIAASYPEWLAQYVDPASVSVHAESVSATT